MGKERTRAGLGEVEHRPLVRKERLKEERSFARLCNETYAIGKSNKPIQKRTVELLRKKRMVRHAVPDRTLQIRTLRLQRKLLKLFPCDFSQSCHAHISYQKHYYTTNRNSVRNHLRTKQKTPASSRGLRFSNLSPCGFTTRSEQMPCWPQPSCARRHAS